MSGTFEIVSSKLLNPPEPLNEGSDSELVFGVFCLRYGALDIVGARLVCFLDPKKRSRHGGTFRMLMPGRGRLRRIHINDPVLRENLVMAALIELSQAPAASAAFKPVAKAAPRQENRA